MAAVYVVTIPASRDLGVRMNGKDTCVVWAATSADAIAMAKAQYDGDTDADWAAATATAMAAGTSLGTMAMRFRVTDTGYDPNGTPGDELLLDVTVLAAATAAVKATGTLTTSTNPSDTNTVVIGTRTYTFQSSLTNVEGHVKIGASETATLLNLSRAINASGGTPGTDYALVTTANPDIESTAATAHTVAVRALVAGTAGNALATTDTLTQGGDGFAAATLLGGVDASSFDSFAAAAVTAIDAVAGFTPSYNASTNVLTVAAGGDALGDNRLDVDVYDAAQPDHTSIPGLVGTITHLGSSGAALTVALAADAYSLPSAAVKLSQRVRR